jgi:hypothetical protein
VYTLLRFVKVLAVGALFAGSIGAILARDLADRRRFAFWLAAPGFAVAWICGFLLVAVTDRALLVPWTIGGVALSIVSLNGVLYAVGKEGRRTLGAAALILVPLVATVALMVWRPE